MLKRPSAWRSPTVTTTGSNGSGGWDNPALSPAYDPDTKSYTLNLTTDYTTAYFYAGTNADGQTVTAKVNGSALGVTEAVNGFTTANISLGSAQTTVKLTVTAADGAATSTYTIVIRRGVEAGKLGDVNLDGSVDAADLTALARHVSNISQLTDPEALANANVNGDSDISAADLTRLARYVAKIINEL